MKSGSVEACVITGFGINADVELASAFEKVGARASSVHVRDLIGDPRILRAFRILAFPGGFSFGDHLGSGKVFALLFKKNLGGALEEFIARGGLVIGICNGFQSLVKMGLLPNLSGTGEQEVSLIHNDSGKFEDRWVRVAFDPSSPCVWTRGLTAMDLHVRHGEGKLVVRSPEVRERIGKGRLAVVRYTARDGGPAAYPENPNGSIDAIAGISDPTGRIFGLMPHPEAFLFAETHPDWSRGGAASPLGIEILRVGVAAARDAG